MERTERDCIRSLLEAAERLDESPTKAAYEDLGLTPASATIQRVMGGWNAAKEAAGLPTNSSRGTRMQPKPDDVELPGDLTWEELSVYQRWHYKNREWNTERTLRRPESLRNWLNEYKKQGCRRCAVSDPSQIDFHHTDPESKELAVNEMVTMGYGRDAIESEIEKCELPREDAPGP